MKFLVRKKLIVMNGMTSPARWRPEGASSRRSSLRSPPTLAPLPSTDTRRGGAAVLRASGKGQENCRRASGAIQATIDSGRYDHVDLGKRSACGQDMADHVNINVSPASCTQKPREHPRRQAVRRQAQLIRGQVASVLGHYAVTDKTATRYRQVMKRFKLWYNRVNPVRPWDLMFSDQTGLEQVMLEYMDHLYLDQNGTGWVMPSRSFLVQASGIFSLW